MFKKHFKNKVPYKQKKAPTEKAKKSKKKTVHHPLYGDIPVITTTGVDHTGKEHVFEEYDPSYQPPLPAGAVRGNVELQNFCSHCHFPKYFYIDLVKTCVQCEQEFVFLAKEQKYWYETLKFNFRSQAIRCPSCRKKKRSAKAINNQVQNAYKIYEQNPIDPLAMLALAEAICLQYQSYRVGNLNLAISLTRKALRCDPTYFEAVYLEAIAQLYSNRKARAYTLFQEFLQNAKLIPRYRNLCTKVETFWLPQTNSEGSS